MTNIMRAGDGGRRPEIQHRMNYGYYLTIGEQLAETRDHVNLL